MAYLAMRSNVVCWQPDTDLNSLITTVCTKHRLLPVEEFHYFRNLRAFAIMVTEGKA